jgi:autotransporter-associated beta strand protein
MRFKLLAVAFLCFVSSQLSYGGSATWNLNPVDDDWINPNNWTPTTFPNGPSDAATFGVSNMSIISLATDIEVAEMIFQPGASAYVIGTAPNGAVLTMSGAGVTNNSGISQIIAVLPTFSGPGGIVFTNSATAGSQVSYPNNGVSFGTPPEIDFMDNSSAGSATFTNSGAFAAGIDGSLIAFVDSSNAGQATLINNGATVGGGGGGVTRFIGTSRAGAATLIANAGQSGGEGGVIEFRDRADGGQASVQVFGNGTLQIVNFVRSNVTIGSLEGDGVVLIDSPTLLRVGKNGQSTTFSGTIQGSGGLKKIGRGTLELTGASSYANATLVEEGTLLVNNLTGSATTSVTIVSGTLGGSGTIDGLVQVGTVGNGRIAPGIGARGPTTLHVSGGVHFFSSGSLACRFYPSRGTSDSVNGDHVTIDAGASFSFPNAGAGQIVSGTVFTLINNLGSSPIFGNFTNLPDGGTVTSNGNKFLVDYEGGDGNDLTLTVVP